MSLHHNNLACCNFNNVLWLAINSNIAVFAFILLAFPNIPNNKLYASGLLPELASFNKDIKNSL